MNAIDLSSPIERPRLSDTIYGQLLEEIMAGRFSAGDRLPTENQLAQRFSVSRPVVREALQRLQTDGVVIARQGSGTYVQRSPSHRVAELTSQHSLHEVLQVMELRMALEELSAKLAARNRTDEHIHAIEHARRALGEAFGQGAAAKEADYAFHRAIAVASGNNVLVEALDQLSERVKGGMNVTLSLTREAMALPLRFPADPAGVARGLGKLASRYGKPVIAYVKDEGYINSADLAALVQEGSVCAVKYAIVRPDPRLDPVLDDLVQRMGSDLIISGIGERPVIDHFRRFGLRAFTSGSTCVAPALSNRIREALHKSDDASAKATRELFMPLEDARDAHSPIRILHAAVDLAGIAKTGPIGEFLSAIDDPRVLDELKPIALALLAHNKAALPKT